MWGSHCHKIRLRSKKNNPRNQKTFTIHENTRDRQVALSLPLPYETTTNLSNALSGRTGKARFGQFAPCRHHNTGNRIQPLVFQFEGQKAVALERARHHQCLRLFG